MSTNWYLFPEPIVLAVTGKDARRYLNNRLSNDLRTLQPNEAARAAALTSNGRVEGLFTVFVESAESFLLACDGGNREGVKAALAKFIVADRVNVTDISACAVVAHVAMESSQVRESVSSVATERKLLCARMRVSTVGSDVILVTDVPIDGLHRLTELFGPALSEESYNLLRIKQGVPVYPDEINEDVILSECGVLDAVSFSKGCYVGQEVIERSDAIGRLPRSLERIRLLGSGLISVGEQVLNAAGEPIGKVLTSALDLDATLMFALLRNGKYGRGDSVTCAGHAGEIMQAEQVVQ